MYGKKVASSTLTKRCQESSYACTGAHCSVLQTWSCTVKEKVFEERSRFGNGSSHAKIPLHYQALTFSQTVNCQIKKHKIVSYFYISEH